MTDKLLPCPFCGETAHLNEVDAWWVRCDGCNAETEAFMSPEEATERWNRRAPPANPQMTDLIEQVARNLRRDFNIREFDRNEDTGWEADIEEAERAIKAVDAARAAPSPQTQTAKPEWWQDEAAAEKEFTEYFCRNYPGPDTVISDPKWHAPKLFRAAKRALMATVVTPATNPHNRAYPVELTDDLRDILSLMMWTTGPMAHALRAGGQEIKQKAEEEQAEVMHWLIGLALEHGSEWRAKASERIREIKASVAATAPEGSDV